MKSFYYSIADFFTRHIERLKRAYQFARFGYNNPDYDYAFVFELLSFKLSRLLDALINGVAAHDLESLDALREAIMLCDRLAQENYEEPYYTEHEAKWGKLKTESRLVEGKEYYQMTFSRPNVITEEQKKAEVEDLKAIRINSDVDRLQDLARLFEILKNYMRFWWD